jgi:hypothetical protein
VVQVGKLNSRKLFVTVLTLVSCSGLLVTKNLESGDFASIIMAVVGAYMASRAWVDGKKKEPE